MAETLPTVFIRKITLGTGTVKLDLYMKKLACSRLDQLHNMEIKAILSFDSDLTKKLVNKEVNLSFDFNTWAGPVLPDTTVQKVFTADNIFVEGSGTLYRRRDPDGNEFYDIPIVMEFDVSRIWPPE